MDWADVKLIVRAFYMELFRQPVGVVATPIVMFAFGLIMIDMDLSSQLEKPAIAKLKVALAGDSKPLQEAFDPKKFSISQVGRSDLIDTVRSARADAGVLCGDGLSQALASATPNSFTTPEVSVNFDSGRMDSDDVFRRTMAPLEELRDSVLSRRLEHIGISQPLKVITNPLTLQKATISQSEVKKAANDARSFATWAVLTAALGATIFGGALLVDEQEKGTLAILLISPTANASVITAFFLCGISATLLLLSPCALALFLYSSQHQHASFAFFPGIVPEWFLLFILQVVLANSICIMLSTWAPKRRQLSIVAGVVTGGSLLLTAVAFSPTIEPNNITALMPFGGTALAMQQRLLGIHNPGFFGVNCLSAVAYSALAFAITVYRMNSAAILELTTHE